MLVKGAFVRLCVSNLCVCAIVRILIWPRIVRLHRVCFSRGNMRGVDGDGGGGGGGHGCMELDCVAVRCARTHRAPIKIYASRTRMGFFLFVPVVSFVEQREFIALCVFAHTH